MATGGVTFFPQHDGKLSCLEPEQAFSELDGTNSLDEYGNPSSKMPVGEKNQMVVRVEGGYKQITIQSLEKIPSTKRPG